MMFIILTEIRILYISTTRHIFFEPSWWGGFL
jgi:hypothetical protein